jgi:hypothetical protein
MDSSDSIYTVYNKNEETIEYYNNDNRIYERTRDIENSINNLLIDENKKKPQNLLCVYFCFFFILGALVTVITYLIIRWS